MTTHAPSTTLGNSSNKPASAAADSKEKTVAATPVQKLTQRERRMGTPSETSVAHDSERSPFLDVSCRVTGRAQALRRRQRVLTFSFDLGLRFAALKVTVSGRTFAAGFRSTTR